MVSIYLVKKMPKGEKNKLSGADKAEIFKLKGVKSGYKVAEDFGVSHTAIYKIWNSPLIPSDMVLGPTGSIDPGIDTQILKKLIPAFAQAGLKVSLEPEEIKRIQEIGKEVL